MHFPSVWNFLNCFSALKQEQIPTGKYDVHVGMLHMNLLGLLPQLIPIWLFPFFVFLRQLYCD